jgi:hypothetical protein
MKALNWIANITAGIGLVLLILGTISAVFVVRIIANHPIYYFIVANSFFLITIILFVIQIKNQLKKE